MLVNVQLGLGGRRAEGWGGGRGVKEDIISQKSSLELLLVLLFGDMVLLEAT